MISAKVWGSFLYILDVIVGAILKVFNKNRQIAASVIVKSTLVCCYLEVMDVGWLGFHCPFAVSP